MKMYEEIIKNLESEAAENSELANELLIYPHVWTDFKNNNSECMKEVLSELESKGYKNYSEEYWYYISNYHCPFFGGIDMFLLIDNTEGNENTIMYNIDKIDDDVPGAHLLPIACANGDYIYLDQKGMVIQWTGVANKSIPEDFFSKITLEEYAIGCNVAYMPYPNKEGNYLMYMVLSLSFDDFMNEYVFGDRYPELLGEEDEFYRCVRNIKKANGMASSYQRTDTKSMRSIGRQIKNALKNVPERTKADIVCNLT